MRFNMGTTVFWSDSMLGSTNSRLILQLQWWFRKPSERFENSTKISKHVRRRGCGIFAWTVIIGDPYRRKIVSSKSDPVLNMRFDRQSMFHNSHNRCKQRTEICQTKQTTIAISDESLSSGGYYCDYNELSLCKCVLYAKESIIYRISSLSQQKSSTPRYIDLHTELLHKGILRQYSTAIQKHRWV